MEEIWKRIEEYPNYEVSNMGRVKNVNRNIILTPLDNGKGYKYVQLWKGGRHKYYIHRLVANSFIPNPENRTEVDHINGDPSDNRAENLRWATKFENMNNPVTTNRMSTAKKNQEKGNHQTPITQYDLNGNFIKEYPTIKEAVMETGTNRTSIISCANGRYKTANGFRWGYTEKKGAA